MRAQDIIKHLWKKHHVPNSDINIEDLIVKTIEDITFSCTYCDELCVLSRCCPQHEKSLQVKGQKCSAHPWAHECHKCELSLTDCSDFWEHTLDVHSDNDIVKCNLCTMRTKYLFMLEDHIRDKHGKELSVLARHSASSKQKTQVTVDGVTVYMCMDCDATGENILWLKTHLLTHTKEKCACNVCGKQFTQRSNLTHHKKITHQEPRPHECSVCGKTFGSRGNLFYHMRIHTDERSYVCELCGKSFVQWASLFYHKFSHGEERKFVCSYCGQTYKNPNHLRSHMNIHTKKIKYVCETCGKEFFKRESLKSHHIVHMTARPFACEYCPADFKLRKHLNQHYKTHTKK
uniref:Zinc finger protein 865 n=1 Tax=Cacopsylla melanoneura TaxID=428564 RepID=A0A8D9EIB5_9HEMI